MITQRHYAPKRAMKQNSVDYILKIAKKNPNITILGAPYNFETPAGQIHDAVVVFMDNEVAVDIPDNFLVRNIYLTGKPSKIESASRSLERLFGIKLTEV